MLRSIDIDTPRVFAVDEAVKARREPICRACRHFDGRHCQRCGCGVGPSLFWRKVERCPEKRWNE